MADRYIKGVQHTVPAWLLSFPRGSRIIDFLSKKIIILIEI